MTDFLPLPNTLVAGVIEPVHPGEVTGVRAQLALQGQRVRKDVVKKI
jgi:hypothetical protein